MLGELLDDALALALEGSRKVLLFPLAALAERSMAIAASSSARGSSWGRSSSMSRAASRSFCWIVSAGARGSPSLAATFEKVEGLRLGFRA